jgi:hypothetical protein
MGTRRVLDMMIEVDLDMRGVGCVLEMDGVGLVLDMGVILVRGHGILDMGVILVRGHGVLMERIVDGEILDGARLVLEMDGVGLVLDMRMILDMGGILI